MKIYIITMEDPIFTVDFFKEIIQSRAKDIVGIAISKGGRLKIGKKRSKLTYLLSLFIIMGPCHFLKNVLITLSYRIQKSLEKYFKNKGSKTLSSFAKKYGIPIINIDSPNAPDFINHLRSISPDIIINQCQHIIKKQLLEIPRLGVLNRHNALLPKNRGRLTPFWVLFNGENETGVTIHLVDEGIDSGPIIVQKKFKVEKKDTFNSVAAKNYMIASPAMLEAIKILEEGHPILLENNSNLSTYNTVPTLFQAIIFRWRIIYRRLT